MYAFVSLIRLLTSIIRLMVVLRQRRERGAGARADQALRLADEHSSRGHNKRKEGNFDGAIDDYSLAIAVDPNDVDHYFFGVYPDRSITPSHPGTIQYTTQQRNGATGYPSSPDQAARLPKLGVL